MGGTKRQLTVNCNGKVLSVRAGTRIDTLLKTYPHRGPFPAIGAVVNKRLVSLSYPLKSHASVTSVDLSRREGMDIYRRTASGLLYAAFLQCFPKGSLEVGQSIGDGYFFD